jgi:LDH2 family malate/lactate/ureidoglycolate dehydrogenase
VAELRFSGDELTELATAVLAALGAPDDIAAAVAGSLITSNLMGHDSHGVLRLSQYSRSIKAGQIIADARPVLASRRGSTGIVDGCWGFGQPAATMAADQAVGLATEFGVGAVTVARCNHIGRLGEYVATMAARGCAGIAFCNSNPVVAPTGGTARTLGTNPVAMAVPQPGGTPVLLDFSTAALAEGKLQVALARGESIPPGVVVDSAGNPSTKPQDFYDGGALLPFGGHKGSGLAVMIELIGGLFSGIGTAPSADYVGGNGTMLIALSVGAFTDPAGYGRSVAEFASRMAEAGDNVLMPGEIEARTAADRRVAGIPVPDSIRRQVTTLADAHGVELGRFALREDIRPK